MDIRFDKFEKGKNWVNGTIDGGEYYFESKLFDIGSIFGINEGRVSKLRIGNDNDSFIINYDRGWDVKPKTEKEKELFKNVLNFLENAPKLFD